MPQPARACTSTLTHCGGRSINDAPFIVGIDEINVKTNFARIGVKNILPLERSVVARRRCGVGGGDGSGGDGGGDGGDDGDGGGGGACGSTIGGGDGGGGDGGGGDGGGGDGGGNGGGVGGEDGGKSTPDKSPVHVIGR